MTGYLVLGVFIGLVVSCFACFLLGWSKGREKEAKMNEEIERRRAETAKNFQQLSEELKQGVKNEAETKKANLSGGSTGRERFDNINNSLQDNP